MFMLQKRAIRIVANSKYNAHTEPLFKLFRILKLSDVLILQTMKVYTINSEIRNFQFTCKIGL